MKIKYSVAGCIVALIVVSCEKTIPDSPLESEVDGQLEGLTYQENLQFLRRDEAFSEVFTSGKGPGPLFVTNSCFSCHAGDSKGHPFTTLTRFGQKDGTGNQYLSQGGPQLQNRALPDICPNKSPLMQHSQK